SLLSYGARGRLHLHSFPTRRSSDLNGIRKSEWCCPCEGHYQGSFFVVTDFAVSVYSQGCGRFWEFDYVKFCDCIARTVGILKIRSEEHTSELRSRENLVCRLLLEKK